ncbi:MAG: HepT-like ribonuclease domain-containing protein [Myxococcota bacterium]
MRRLLADHGVISSALAQRMAEAGGMRNAILHGYEDIDWARVHAATLDLGRIRDFLAAVRPH